MSHRIIVYSFKPAGSSALAAGDTVEGCSGSVTYVPPDSATPEEISATTRKIIKLADKMNAPDTPE